MNIILVYAAVTAISYLRNEILNFEKGFAGVWYPFQTQLTGNESFYSCGCDAFLNNTGIKT
jgi:hypothetical protein